MATSSKFIQLTGSVLLEYIYADKSQINQPGNVFRLRTDTTPIWLLKNQHTGISTILNSDANEYISPNSVIGTGNVRNRSFAQIENYRGALLDIDRIQAYNDYDSKLTPTNQLPIIFSTVQAPVYDTIRLHLTQGFNFEEYKGLSLNLRCKDKNNKDLNLLNLIYNSVDAYATLNPTSFFFGGRVYDSYIEVKVLSLYNLIYDYWLGTLSGDTVVEKITENVGILRNQQISINFNWIRDRKSIDGQDFIFLSDGISVDIPTQDQFEVISAYIEESTNGDYIEFYGKYKDRIIEQFILDLNQNGNDYILLHDLTVFEYIYDNSSGQYFWQKTDELQLSQIDNYGEPNFYRPIVRNPSAVSFKIDYVIRLYNRIDNSQIWKSSSIVSNSAAKYGRKMMKLNLGLNPIQSKIFNKQIVKDIQLNRINEPIISNTKYITSFIDSSQISISYDSINPEKIVSGENSTLTQINKDYLGKSNSTTIYSNGLAKVLISNSITFLKFVIYQKDPKTGSNQPINLSGIGEIVLSFQSGNNEMLDVIEFPNTFASKTRGEVVFRISETESNRILSFVDRNFRLFLKNEKGEKTFLYIGKFYDQMEWMNLAETDKIKKLENLIDTMTISNNSLMVQIRNQTDIIEQLTTQNRGLSKQLSTELSNDAKEEALINSQASQITSLQATIDNLNQNVKDLTSQLSLYQSDVISGEGMISVVQKQLAEQSIILGTSMNLSNRDLQPVQPNRPITPTQPAIEKKLEQTQADINQTSATTYIPPTTRNPSDNGGTFTTNVDPRPKPPKNRPV